MSSSDETNDLSLILTLDEDFQKFGEVLLANLQPLISISVTDSEHRKWLREHISQLLFDTDSMPVSSRQVLSKPDDVFLSKLAFIFFEIKTTMEHLQDFEIYASSFPFKKKGISPLRYLIHVIGTYLNEMYILKERLESLINFIKKKYKKTNTIQNLTSELFLIRQSFTETLTKLNTIRGKHVHEKRYESPDLERLVLLSILEENKETLVFQYMYREEFNKLKKIWKNRISHNNSETKKLLNFCFGRLLKILFDEGKLIYPDGTKAN